VADRNAPDWAKLANLTPKEAYDYFRAKALVPSFRWADVWEKEHATAFTVAGMLREDLLATVHDKLTKAIEEGRDAAWFEKELTPILETAGWWGRKDITDPETGEVRSAQLGSPSRLQLIYDVNVRQAYHAGRWEQAQRTKSTAPLMIYTTMRDERVRKSHADLDGVVAPIDDPFWDTHYGMNGYNCRCSQDPVSEEDVEDLRRAGYKIKKPPKVRYTTYTRPDGTKLEVPVGIDPGFGYNVGKSRDAGLAAAKTQQRAKLPKRIRDAADAIDRKKGKRDGG